MGFDLQKMMKQVQKVQSQMSSIQSELEEIEVTGTSGGGAVTVVCNGKLEFKSVKLTPDAIQDLETLEDLFLSALKDANTQVAKLAEQKFSSVTSGLNIPGLSFPGF